MQTLAGKVESARPGQHGLDRDAPITRQLALGLRRLGFTFCVRYLSRGAPQHDDLTASEAEGILGGGLALMPVQHVQKGRWVPAATLGGDYGAAAVHHAQSVGFPAGVNVWLDLEGVKVGTPPEDVVAYCNRWFDTVSDAGYVPGLYVGADPGLDGHDLFWRLRTKHYWASASWIPDVAIRGYQMKQSRESHIVVIPGQPGIQICRDVCLPDALGATPLWLSPAGAARTL
jgi:hypothetical protein